MAAWMHKFAKAISLLQKSSNKTLNTLLQHIYNNFTKVVAAAVVAVVNQQLSQKR